MIYKQLAPTCEQVRVTFELPSCVWADRIYVAGDFNQWCHTETPLKQDRAGVWRAEVELPVGHQFEFRYLIDGKWHTDHHADGSRPNELGTDNSVLDTTLFSVPVQRQEVASTALGYGAPRLTAAARPLAPAPLQRRQG
jgi:hypothetical protein